MGQSKSSRKSAKQASKSVAPAFPVLGREAVDLMLEFQQTGLGFERLWDGVAPTVDGMLRGRLRKRSVRGHGRRDDEVAVAEAAQHVRIALWKVPGKGPTSWFDPDRSSDAVDALRAWLHGFCEHAVAAYCDTWRHARRRRKVITESGLRHDEQREATSILKAAPAKIEVDDRELREIVNECVDGLDDELRKLLRLNRRDGTSERAIASQTGLTVSAVHRRIEKALKNLKKTLEARGIDESWLNDGAFGSD